MRTLRATTFHGKDKIAPLGSTTVADELPSSVKHPSLGPMKACAAQPPSPAFRASLSEIFNPKSIAVIGATETRHSVGRAILENLGAFRGRVFGVNPKHDSILGFPAYASVGAIPEPVDLAIVATPAPTVPAIVGECAAAGVKGVVIISAGFKETGASGQELERQILANRGTMRVLGPNCLGLMIPHLGLNATFAASMAQCGKVAFLSQSGALCTAILDWSLREEVGFSAFVSLGSMLDIGWGDLIEFFGDDPHTKSIVCYMESVGEARAFLSAAREVAFNKPIVVIKVGRTEAAAKAAASHTGSLTGSDDVLDAAFRRAGIVRVETIEELFDMAEVLAKQPAPSGPRLAIVTNAGGPGALATDMLVSAGGQLAKLSPETLGQFDQLLPPAWSHGNPVDLLGSADAETYGRAVEIALGDGNVDGALVILTPQAMTDSDGTAAQLASLTRNSSKPVLASWMGGASLETARTILNAAAVPTYDYPDAAARAFALMWQYSDRLRLLYERPALPPTDSGHGEKRSVAERLIANARKAGRTLLTEVESKHLLSAYGIPTVETFIAHSESAAVKRARSLGYPVVLKVYSETITHKTDVGGVRLHLENDAAVRRAWREIKEAVSAKVCPDQFQGVTVQPMIPRDGVELIIGSSIDPQFGPVLLFGAGGELVEILKDRAIGFPPLTTTLARRLMERTRIIHALKGARGRKPVDLNALAELLVAFSHLVAEQRWIAEIDINPLLANATQLLALDARVVLHPMNKTEADLPRLAIRPYPTEYISEIRLTRGACLTLRPIRPDDEELLIAFHAALSDESVGLRYFGPLSLETRTEHRRLSRVCFSDYDRELALVAIRGKGATRELVAVGRLNRIHGTNSAEFALLVADAWQGRGLGTQLLEALIRVGKSEKLDLIVGSILAANHSMVDLCRRHGFHMKHQPGESVLEAELRL